VDRMYYNESYGHHTLTQMNIITVFHGL